MPAIRRRSLATSVGTTTTLAAADDLNGAAVTLDVTGAMGVIIAQLNTGTLGTAGIDVIQESHDGGKIWELCDTLLNLGDDPFTGTVLTALNAAGVEPPGGAVFKAGPFEGPTLIRCGRGGAGVGELGTAWVTGAPAVVAAIIK